MTDQDWQRARQPEQREERRQAILEAAARLLDRDGVGFSFNAVGREAGLSKSNIYRYFGSREEILLTLLAGDYVGWAQDTTRWIEAHEGTIDAAVVATALASSAAARPRMCTLIAILPGVLEQNLSEEAYLAFKLRSAEVLNEGAALLASRLPGLSPAGALRALRYMFIAMVGLWPMAHPPTAHAHLLDRPELEMFRISFERELAYVIETLLTGAATP